MPCLFAQLILTPLLSHVRKPKSQDIRQTNSDYQLMARQKLPLGIQDFDELRRGGYLYVDKTDMLWKIANGNKYNFLSRPGASASRCSRLPCNVISKDGASSLRGFG